MQQADSDVSTQQSPGTVPPEYSEHPDAWTVEEVTAEFPEMDRPSVLQYQVDSMVAKTLLEELTTEQVYEHLVDGEQRHRAWRLSDTASDAVIEITLLDNDGDVERRHYAVPPIGETLLDLRWWALNCEANDRRFEISHLSNKALTDVLSCTPDEWQGAIRTLLFDGME